MYGHDRLPLSPPSYHPDEPGTPTKKRLLNFAASPASSRMAALTNGLDNMEHERYSLSPVGRRTQDVLLSPRKGVRSISRTPFKVLDAPELAVRVSTLS
jgi:cell division cycle 20-like protein 1 (cofactor of APC complex)